jgi:hypothetical protein
MLESILEVLLPCAVPAVPPKERCEEEPVLARPKAPPCPADPEHARSAATDAAVVKCELGFGEKLEISLSECVRLVVIPFPPVVAVIPDTSVRVPTRGQLTHTEIVLTH